MASKRTMPRQQRHNSKQNYGTPADFLAAVKRRLGIEAFSLDIAAERTNAVCGLYYSEKMNALRPDLRWGVAGGWSWLNPEFEDIAPWAEKSFRESRRGAQIAFLTPASIGANWYRDWVSYKGLVIPLNGRLKFVGATDQYPKDCILTLFGPTIAPGYTEPWTWGQA